MTMIKKSKGLSLIELMIVIGIVAGATYLFVPMFKKNSEAEALSRAKNLAVDTNKNVVSRIKKLFDIRTSGVSEGVMLDSSTPFFLRFETTDPTGAKTRQYSYRTVCETVASNLNLSSVEGDFCGGSKSLTGCGPGNRMVLQLTFDPDKSVAGDEQVENLTAPFRMFGESGERQIISQILCAKTAAAITGVQSVPLNSDIRVEIASAYSGTKDQVRWEKTTVVLPVRASAVSSIELLDTR